MQYTLEGLTKDQVAIERIRMFEPSEGYYLAFSGGKDSVTLLALAKAAGVKFDAHYHLTTVDPPEVVQFIKTFHEVEIVRPPKSMWQLIVDPENQVMPTRQMRWCCKRLKEVGGHGRFVLTGIRWAESVRRANRKMLEVSRGDTSKKLVHPILDWTDEDVWQFIREKSIPYCSLYDQGFKRLGCVLCPMVKGRLLQMQIERYPKIVAAWRSAAEKLYDLKMLEGKQMPFRDADDAFDVWLHRGREEPESQQATFDDCLVPFSD